MEFFSRGKPLAFTAADNKLDQFEALLLEHGLTIQCGSMLEDIFLSTKKYLALNKREMTLPPTTDLRDEWVRMRADVYCLLVPAHGNFAIAAGVFVADFESTKAR